MYIHTYTYIYDCYVEYANDKCVCLHQFICHKMFITSFNMANILMSKDIIFMRNVATCDNMANGVAPKSRQDKCCLLSQMGRESPACYHIFV